MAATTPGIGRLYKGIEPAVPTLAVVNRRAPQQLQRILETVFEHQPVEVVEQWCTNASSDLVQLIEHETVIASSPLEELTETILLVNSDRYITDGTVGKPATFPAVLKRLDEIPFTVRGYPHSHREKLLFIAISRLIEQQAAEATTGMLRSSFQEVARLATEPGTRVVYERLLDRPVDLKLFGHGAETPAPFEDVLVRGDRWAHRHTWIVSFRNESHAAALFAAETQPKNWTGYWTFDPARVDRINRWVDEHLQPSHCD